MNQTRLSSIALAAVFVISSTRVLGHPGSLDSRGGHFDRLSGGYHFHAGENTSSGSSNSNYSRHLHQREPTDYSGLFVFAGFLVFILFFIGLWRAANDKGSYTSKVIVLRIAGFLFLAAGITAFTGRGPTPLAGILFSILGICALVRKIPSIGS